MYKWAGNLYIPKTLKENIEKEKSGWRDSSTSGKWERRKGDEGSPPRPERISKKAWSTSSKASGSAAKISLKNSIRVCHSGGI